VTKLSNTKNNPLILLKKRALYYLAKREYSHLELKLKLSEYAQMLELNKEALDLFLSALVAEGWLSNERYCEQFIHAKKNKFGRYKIVRELEDKGIDQALTKNYYMQNRFGKKNLNFSRPPKRNGQNKLASSKVADLMLLS